MRRSSDIEEVGGASDDRSMAALYEQYRDALYGYCVSRTNDPASADDIVQDTFVKLLAARGRIDLGRPVWPLLVAIANRACIDAHRRRSYATERLDRLTESMAESAVIAESAEADVVRRVEHERLQAAVAALPRRQRAALQLYALEGRTYAEVAAQMGDSVVTVKSLLQRARRGLREGVDRRAVAVLGGWRAWRARRQEACLHAHLALEALTGAGAAHMLTTVAVLSTSVSVLLAALYGSAPSGSSAAATGASAEAVDGDRIGRGSDAAGTGSAQGGGVLTGDAVGRNELGVAERAVNEAVESALPPPADRTPENASLTTIEVSPAYEDDHTVFAAEAKGAYNVSALFISRDGGASWHRPRALGFGGASRFLFPPGYPAGDRRFFALGAKGLQVSHDGGESFETLLPGWFRDGAVSPGFASGDPTILLTGGGLLYEYRYDTGASWLVQVEDWQGLKVDAVRWESANSTPGIVVAGHRFSRGTGLLDVKSTFVGRCARRADGPLPADAVGPVRFDCESAELPDSQDTFVSLPRNPSPGASRIVGHYDDISVSTDGGRTYRPTFKKSVFSMPELMVFSVEVLPFAGPGSAIAAGPRSRSTPGPSLMRTDDSGATWTGVEVPVPGFARGSWAIGVAPTGRLFATGTGWGSGGPIACSADGGRTWASRCATPELPRR